MAVILGVGIATLDIVNHVPAYPAENSELRAARQTVSVGGNTANTLRVLAQLGHSPRFAGVCSDDGDGAAIRQQLQQAGVSTRFCHLLTGHAPTSYILLSEATGSRSIVHYRDLPEYGFAQFRRLPLEGVEWVHFEGRSVQDTRRMLDWIAKVRPDLRCSLEVEKPREGIESLLEGPQLILFSQSYAEARGYRDGHAFLQQMKTRLPNTIMTCAWGGSGAWGWQPGGKILHQASMPPNRLVDTLGAGDVFNAAAIDAVLANRAIDQLLRQSCQLAGKKCGQSGLENLAAST